MSRRAVPLVLLGLVLGAPALSAQSTAPTVFHACYVPLTGTVYRIMESRLPDACVSDDHVPFSWTDDEDALRAGEAAGGDLAGDWPAPTVAGLRGRALATTPPADGDVLTWDGEAGQWVPGAPATPAVSGLTSPDGSYRIAVSDDGIVLTGTGTEIRMDVEGLLFTGPGTEIRMTASGVVVKGLGSEIALAGDHIDVTSPGRLHLSDGIGNEIVTDHQGVRITGPTVEIAGAAAVEITGAGVLDLRGGILTLNGCGGPVVVQGSSYVVATGYPGPLQVQGGVPTVCAGR